MSSSFLAVVSILTGSLVWCIIHHDSGVIAFMPPHVPPSTTTVPISSTSMMRGKERTRLWGINEWRDTMFDIPGTGRNDEEGNYMEDGIPRKVGVLPFPFDEVLLQGETKQLRLYEDRFIQLFDNCMEKHSGIVAMGLIADAGIIQTVPLCEVEAYNRMDGFGIFVTIRVVGRASLLSLSQQEPYIIGTCIEISDSVPPNLDLPNLVAGNIENFFVTLSSLENKLKQITNNSGSESNLLENVSDADMRRRIVEAQLEDTYYDDSEDTEESIFPPDDDNMNDDDDDEDIAMDRTAQFQEAFRQAKSCDSQGYMTSASSSPMEGERSAQDLTAISWAIFCTDDVDQTIRIQALDCDDLFDRLKMGSSMLRENKAELEAKLALTDVKMSEDEEDE